MQKIPAALLLAALVASPIQAQPPREESPAPREMLEAFGAGNSDEEIEKAITAANAFPLGTLENPIRTEGPEGAQAYLARLRCGDGSMPKIGDKAPGGVGTYGTVVESVALDCGSAAPGKVTLVMDMYHAEHAETRAPAGFTTASP
jgi:hypothetical protein